VSKRRRTNPNNKFVMLERWFWRCPAWQALPHPARSLYLELEMLYTGNNNGAIEMGVRKAARLLGCSINLARKMFAELEEKGFAKPNQRGSFSWKARHETTWILTLHEYAGRPGSKDFMQWKPTEKQNTVSPRDTDGITRRYPGALRTLPTVSRGDTVRGDSDPLTVSPGDTSSSIPPVPRSEPEPIKNQGHHDRAPRRTPSQSSNRTNGKRGRGRPSVAPQIIALLPGLVARHGNRLMIGEITEAAIEARVVTHAQRGTPDWNGRRQVVRRALRKADLGDIRIEGL
jgi:hypothetical protein